MRAALRRSPRRLAALAALCLAIVPAAGASRPATDGERAALAQLSGINGACLDIAFSTVDPTYAAYGFTGAAGCPNKGNMVAVQGSSTGFKVVGFLTGGELCPLEGIPTPVALDLKVCKEPPPPTYLPDGKVLREQPTKLTLTKKRGSLSVLQWSSWGGPNAKARGKYRAVGARKILFDGLPGALPQAGIQRAVGPEHRTRVRGPFQQQTSSRLPATSSILPPP